jgi:UDP-N-acetylglucosamine enolpyruvyl transferase
VISALNTYLEGQRVSFRESGHTIIGEILAATDSTQTVVHGNDRIGYRTTDIHWTKLTPLADAAVSE